MAVNYVILKNRFKKGTGVGAKYIKCISNYIVDTKDMARRISSQCTVTEADIQAVLQAYETNLKMMFAQGNSVRIFNLGTLKPCFKADFDKNGDVVKNSVRLSKVQLITNHTFLNDAKGYEYHCHGEAEDYCPDYEGRVKNMMDYFEQGFDEITAREYVYINDCSKTQACDDLRQLYEEGMLTRRCYGNMKVYRLNQEIPGTYISKETEPDQNQDIETEISENISDSNTVTDTIIEINKSTETQKDNIAKTDNTNNDLFTESVTNVDPKEIFKPLSLDVNSS